jgi:hypothetical protein
MTDDVDVVCSMVSALALVNSIFTLVVMIVVRMYTHTDSVQNPTYSKISYIIEIEI